MSDSARHAHSIERDSDVVTARQIGRAVAAAMGFGRADQALIATAISELARNIVNYAGKGRIEISRVREGGRVGLQVVASDSGPGIADIAAAMTDGFSTGGSLGLGLPGTRRIVDEFSLVSAPGNGVVVKVIRWSP